MENASKALLIAGAFLFAILLISLLVYAINIFSGYQASKAELKNIENTAKFNEQFTNYDRKDVEGYEIISLANKVADYNNRYSTAVNSNSNIKYDPITFTINLVSKDLIKQKLTKDGNTIYLLNITYMTQSTVKNEIENIVRKAEFINNRYGGETAISAITKNSDSIFISNSELERIKNTKNVSISNQKFEALRKFNSFLGNSSTLKFDIDASDANNETKINNYWNTLMSPEYTKDVYTYYEYRQFKRGIFECTNVTYDTNGRIQKMDFKFTGDLH